MGIFNQKFESFVTSVRSDAEALSALVSSASIRRGLSGRRRRCIVTDDGVARVLRLALDEEFDNVLSVPTALTKEYGSAYLSYAAWKLKLWNKCVYTPPGALLLQNCDHLFDLEPWSMVVVENSVHVDGGGGGREALFVYEPSGTVAQKLLHGMDAPCKIGRASCRERV